MDRILFNALRSWVEQYFFKKQDHTYITRGAPDAYRPVATNANGTIDHSLIVGSIGDFTIGDPAPSTPSSYNIKMPPGRSTVNGGDGVDLIITAGTSDNTAGKHGGVVIIRGGAPVAPATEYGDVYLADLGGDLFSTNGFIGGAYTALTYNAGWADFSATWPTLRYKRFGDLVYVSGLVKRTAGVSLIVGTLPSGYRPLTTMRMFSVIVNDAGVEKATRLDVSTTGDLTLPSISAGAIAFASIEICFSRNG